MRKAFSIVELLFVMVILGIMASVSIWYLPRTELKQATEYLINNLKYTKTLAQLDDRYYTMSDSANSNAAQTASQIQNWKLGMWQLQFHNATGNTSSSNSYTIYADQAKAGTTNNFDGIPNAGDLIARDPMTKACLSGYSASNLPDCQNNFSKDVKLYETYQTTIDSISSKDCAWNASSGFSIFFDNLGMPYCKSSNAQLTQPIRLTAPITIQLKRRGAIATICVSKGGIIEASKDGTCQDI